MPYDPTEDPRYVPLPLREQIIQAEVAAELEQALAAIEDVMQLFDTPGWRYVSGLVEREVDLIDTELRKELDRGRWMFLRGQKVWADWMVGLPMEIDGQRTKLQRQLQILLRHEEGEV